MGVRVFKVNLGWSHLCPIGMLLVNLLITSFLIIPLRLYYLNMTADINIKKVDREVKGAYSAHRDIVGVKYDWSAAFCVSGFGRRIWGGKELFSYALCE